MDINLNGKNALVGGSSKGIGKASAIELAALGANITLLARSVERLEATLALLDTSRGQQHDCIAVDFSDQEALENAVSRAVAQKTYHILINNTGGPPAGPITQASKDGFLQAYHNHLLCNHLLSILLIPGMKKAAYGRIINIISTSVKAPLDGLGVSNTTRGAVASWAKTMANELAAFGITVNNVLPGATATERLQEIIDNKAQKTGHSSEQVQTHMQSEIPMGRFGKPEEIAAAVAFLATPAAAYITGTNITVDGGRTPVL